MFVFGTRAKKKRKDFWKTELFLIYVEQNLFFFYVCSWMCSFKEDVCVCVCTSVCFIVSCSLCEAACVNNRLNNVKLCVCVKEKQSVSPRERKSTKVTSVCEHMWGRTVISLNLHMCLNDAQEKFADDALIWRLIKDARWDENVIYKLKKNKKKQKLERCCG